MGLLTLIILGEGIIGLLEAVTTAWVAGIEEYYAAPISTLSCATLILVSTHVALCTYKSYTDHDST